MLPGKSNTGERKSMKRIIKFRGKRVDNGQWVYGDLIHGVGWKKDRIYILPAVENLASLGGCDPLDGYNVIPETVGQLLDCGSNPNLFEGDTVGDCFNLSTETDPQTIEVITWDNFRDRSFTEYIIGNIHDNPELLSITL